MLDYLLDKTGLKSVKNLSKNSLLTLQKLRIEMKEVPISSKLNFPIFENPPFKICFIPNS